MNSKLFVILSLCALVFLVSSAIAIEASKEEELKPVNEEKHRGWGGGGWGGGGRGGGRCCGPNKGSEKQKQTKATPQNEEESNPVNEEKHYGWGGGGGWGGHGGHHGGGGKCCGKDKKTEAKP